MFGVEQRSSGLGEKTYNREVVGSNPPEYQVAVTLRKKVAKLGTLKINMYTYFKLN